MSADDLLVSDHPRSAQHLMLVLTWAAAAVTFGFTLLSRVVEVNATPFWFLVVPMGISVLALALHRHRLPARSPVWLGMPLLAIVVITGLNLGTGDATAAAQVFYTIPVLFAAANLRPRAATVVTIAAIVGDATVVVVLLPMSYALTDITFVSLVLVAITVMLVRATARHDRLVERLRGLAEVDQLTGLATRRAFSEAATAVLREAASCTSTPGTALLVVDVDRFKSINDAYGHLVGDDALVHVADVIRSCTRPDAVIGRIGGDEIVVLLPRCDRATAVARAEQFVEAVRSHPLVVEGVGPLELTVSVGIAHSPSEGVTFRDLFSAADMRLYHAKRDGRDRVGVDVQELPLPFA